MEIIHLLNSMAPYLLLGFLLAGILHAFVPARLYHRHLGRPNFKSVLYATLVAIPLPLCSCGVIPTAMSLRKEGASKGAVISFLIATPQTGVDSILATYSLMGLPFAIIRPIAALATALFGGILSNRLEKKYTADAETAPASADAGQPIPASWTGKVGAALRYAFVEMMEDIGKWLIIGLVIAGLITVYVPDTFFQQYAGSPLLSILLVLVCAIPMYLCATGSIPIAIALMLKGLSPGAALVLLMAGPAVNMGSILVIHRVMGLRALLTYLGSIVGGAVAFALAIDYLLPRDLFLQPLMQNSLHTHSMASPWQWACTALLLLLLANAMVHRYLLHKNAATCHCGDNGCSADDECRQPRLIHIEGMKCNHCRANAEKAIAGVEGVEKVEIDLAGGTALVTGECKLEDIRKAVEAIGFKVR